LDDVFALWEMDRAPDVALVLMKINAGQVGGLEEEMCYDDGKRWEEEEGKGCCKVLHFPLVSMRVLALII
jgi:hypothetical protein